MNRHGEKVAGIVLAAGESTRMGRIKQLLPLGEETLIERILGRILKSRVDTVVLVLGHRAGEIEAVITPGFSDPRLCIIENRRYRRGISTSIAAGISQVEGTHDHAIFFLADMPCIPWNLINRLLDRHLTSGMLISAIQDKGRPAHPVIFRREIYPELKRLKGDMGARSLFPKYNQSICLIQPEEGYDSLDIDTPEDYAGFKTGARSL
ncbi:MAG: nucleotidyltransferase family protein [Deltaproteobacteria bacterium]|nr:nucleotidyltransferase family protein [Deltaproteobacteria bacterium]